MDQPPAVALTAFADAWPRAIETEKGAALCAIGAGRPLIFDYRYNICHSAPLLLYIRLKLDFNKDLTIIF